MDKNKQSDIHEDFKHKALQNEPKYKPLDELDNPDVMEDDLILKYLDPETQAFMQGYTYKDTGEELENQPEAKELLDSDFQDELIEEVNSDGKKKSPKQRKRNKPETHYDEHNINGIKTEPDGHIADIDEQHIVSGHSRNLRERIIPEAISTDLSEEQEKNHRNEARVNREERLQSERLSYDLENEQAQYEREILREQGYSHSEDVPIHNPINDMQNQDAVEDSISEYLDPETRAFMKGNAYKDIGERLKYQPEEKKPPDLDDRNINNTKTEPDGHIDDQHIVSGLNKDSREKIIPETISTDLSGEQEEYERYIHGYGSSQPVWGSNQNKDSVNYESLPPDVGQTHPPQISENFGRGQRESISYSRINHKNNQEYIAEHYSETQASKEKRLQSERLSHYLENEQAQYEREILGEQGYSHLEDISIHDPISDLQNQDTATYRSADSGEDEVCATVRDEFLHRSKNVGLGDYRDGSDIAEPIYEKNASAKPFRQQHPQTENDFFYDNGGTASDRGMRTIYQEDNPDYGIKSSAGGRTHNPTPPEHFPGIKAPETVDTRNNRAVASDRDFMPRADNGYQYQTQEKVISDKTAGSEARDQTSDINKNDSSRKKTVRSEFQGFESDAEFLKNEWESTPQYNNGSPNRTVPQAVSNISESKKLENIKEGSVDKPKEHDLNGQILNKNNDADRASSPERAAPPGQKKQMEMASSEPGSESVIKKAEKGEADRNQYLADAQKDWEKRMEQRPEAGDNSVKARENNSSNSSEYTNGLPDRNTNALRYPETGEQISQRDSKGMNGSKNPSPSGTSASGIPDNRDRFSNPLGEKEENIVQSDNSAVSEKSDSPSSAEDRGNPSSGPDQDTGKDPKRFSRENNQYLHDEQKSYEEKMSDTSSEKMKSHEEYTQDNANGNSDENPQGKDDGRIQLSFIRNSDQGNASDARETNGTRDSSHKNENATIRFTDYPKPNASLKKIAVRSVRGTTREAGLYARMQSRNNHTLRGIELMAETMGVYVFLPAAKSAGKTMKRAGVKFASGFVIKREDFSDNIRLIEDDLTEAVQKMYGKKFTYDKLDKILYPTSNKSVLQLHKLLQNELKKYSLPLKTRELKKLLKTGTLSAKEISLIRVYLNVNPLAKYAKAAQVNVWKNIKGLNRKLMMNFRLTVRRMAAQSNSYTLQGVVFSSIIARRSIKTAIRATKKPIKVLNYTVKTAKQATKAAETMAEASTSVTKYTFKASKGISSRILNGGVSLSKNVFVAGERLSSKIIISGSRAAAKTSSSLTAKTVNKLSKITAKAVSVAVKTAAFAVNLVVSIITSALTIVAPAIIIIVFLLVIIMGFFSIFILDSDTHEAVNLDADGKLVAQQYVDALNECYVKYKDNITALYSNQSYETVQIDYKNEKNEDIYREYKNEEGMVNADNNIKECLCLMSALFDFDMESYVVEDADDEEVRQEDLDNLKTFLEINDVEDTTYRGTFQKLIRTYLVCLFNGSHTIDKRVETTYCDGCVAQYDENNEIISYYCPGHRHLYATVTTYYFDKLFSCGLKQNPDSNGFSIIGSNTVEKIWFAMKNAGYTEEAAAGAIGNLMWESGGGPTDVNLNAVEGNGEGIGMCQWSYERKTDFLNFLASRGETWPNQNADLQIEFMLSELESDDWAWTSIGAEYGSQYNVSLSEFKACTNVSEATVMFCANFERCHERDSNMSTRIKYAQNVYLTYHGKEPGAVGGEGLPPGAKLTPLGEFHITYYCPCEICSEEYGDMTSSGRRAQPNHTIAVDKNVIPLYSKILLPDGIVYTAEDVGGGVNGKHIDIYVASHDETLSPDHGTHEWEAYLVE